jgi:hypothetical protein
MTDENTRIIQSIIESISINPERIIFFNGNEFHFFPEQHEPGLPSHEMLLQALQQLIYNEYYCRYTERDVKDAAINLHYEFTRSLQAANLSIESWDKNWLVDSIDQMGVITIKKGNYLRNAYAGEFIKEDFSHRHVSKGERIRLAVRKEYSDNSQVFYYFFGDTIAEENSQSLVRFYLNLQPEGSPLLIRKTTALFNKYLIPFQAKCISDPCRYNRTDPAVVYLDKRYFKQGIEMLLDIREELKIYFREHCPLFTKKIAEGLSFAENPPGQKSSFGTDRCTIIAQGIVYAFMQQLPKTEWLKAVLLQIEQKGYSLQKFYLNPGSHFPYSFPNL